MGRDGVSGFGFRVSCFGFRVSCFGSEVSRFGFLVSRLFSLMLLIIVEVKVLQMPDC